MRNYFQGTSESPAHISVGGVVRDREGLVCSHYFDHFSHPGLGTFDDFYLLMRETLEPHETIEDCLARGLREEFGIEARLTAYLGSIVSRFPQEGVTMEKTTLYFLCDLVSFDKRKQSPDDPEGGSEIRWISPADLIVRMHEQGARLGREDLDESSMLAKLA